MKFENQQRRREILRAKKSTFFGAHIDESQFGWKHNECDDFGIVATTMMG